VEHGLIRFFYRPPVSRSSIEGSVFSPEDVQRLYILLVPGAPDAEDIDIQDKSFKKRLLVVGKKHVSSEDITPPTACFVGAVTVDMAEVTRMLQHTHAPQATVPTGEGSYEIVQHEGHTYLTYALAPSRKLLKVQNDFRIEQEGSYLLAIKNPRYSSVDPDTMIPRRTFPPELQRHFGEDKRWAPVLDSRFLDYVGAELLLHGVSVHNDEEDVVGELLRAVQKPQGVGKLRRQ